MIKNQSAFIVSHYVVMSLSLISNRNMIAERLNFNNVGAGSIMSQIGDYIILNDDEYDNSTSVIGYTDDKKGNRLTLYQVSAIR